MGKAARWLRGLLGMKKDKENEERFSSFSDKKEKKIWSFGKTSKDSGGGVGVAADSSWLRSSFAAAESEKEQNSQAIAVAAATAAAADAAVAAAQAAVAVVRLTSRGRGALFATQRENWAALKIQSVFRGYLARKALRALRGLVKLQAHVRGYLVRKRAAAILHSMQALIRAQATVRSQRIRCTMTNETRVRKFIERFDECRSAVQSKRLSSSYDPSLNGFDGSPKIVEIDTYKLRSMSRRINNASFYNSGNDLDWSFVGEESNFPTAQSTPRAAGSGRVGAPAPAKSVCGDSFFRPYLNSPGYMGKTESFRAKQRSVSAPKQRLEGPGRKRVSLGEIMASRNSTSGGRMQRSCSQVQKQHGF